MSGLFDRFPSLTFISVEAGAGWVPFLLEQMDDGVFEQVTNVACLPGIVRASLCMPDGHWGYGFPIGGVAAEDTDEGVISPGGVARGRKLWHNRRNRDRAIWRPRRVASGSW